MKRTFLTGGTGFFGKSILSMVKRGFLSEYEFTILSRNPDKFMDANVEFKGLDNVEFIQGDVRDFSFPKGHFDYVIHAGAPAIAMPPGVEREIIMRGTERVLRFVKSTGAQKLMFVSSGAVYGSRSSDEGIITEDSPCHPESEYGIAKLEAEQMCQASDVFTVISRCFAFVGPYLNRDIHFAIGNFIRDALRGEVIVIKGDGTPLRSYMYADDLVRWLFTILEHGQRGIPYNVGSDEPISILQLAELVKETLGSTAEIVVKGIPRDDGCVECYVPSIEKARMELGVSLDVPLKEAILKSSR